MENVVRAPAVERGERRLTWRVFGVLMAGAALGILGILPYAMTLQAPLLETLDTELPPLWILVPLQLIQNLVLVGAATALGLRLGPRVGLGAPVLRGLLAGAPEAHAQLRALLVPSIVLGVLASLAIIVLDGLVFAPQLAGLIGDAAAAAMQPPAWQGFLASFYGGIVEELLLRLGLMTLLVWIATALTRAAWPGPGIVWAGIVGAALLFGAGHLPATAALLPLTPLVVARALLLNGLGGLVFGWLYWRRGLLAAMLAHFSADIVLHVVFPLLSG